jgi:hypothetical protein
MNRFICSDTFDVIKTDEAKKKREKDAELRRLSLLHGPIVIGNNALAMGTHSIAIGNANTAWGMENSLVGFGY